MREVNVYGKKPRIVADSEIVKYEDTSYFIYNDKDVLMGNAELYVNEKPYILISTFKDNVEAKQFVQQHSDDIKEAIKAIGLDDVKYIKRSKAKEIK